MILRAITRADEQMFRSMPDFGKSYNDLKIEFPETLIGCMFLHYVADKKLEAILRGAAQKGLRGEEFAEFLEQTKLDYTEHGAIFKHSLTLRGGHILNSYQWLYEIGTPDGKMYFQTSPDPKDPFITVYKSHFFDSFAWRTGMVKSRGEAPGKRKEAIREFLSSKLAINDDKIMEHDGQVGIGTEKGLCLGVKEGRIMLIKTFVSTDMMRGKQPLLADETSMPLFDQFNSMLEEMNNEKYDYSKFGTITKKQPDVGRNDPCPCGSGKKHKKCCLK